MSYFKNASFYQAEMLTEKKNLFKNGHSWLARHGKHKIVPRLKISINLFICERQFLSSWAVHVKKNYNFLSRLYFKNSLVPLESKLNEIMQSSKVEHFLFSTITHH